MNEDITFTEFFKIGMVLGNLPPIIHNILSTESYNLLHNNFKDGKEYNSMLLGAIAHEYSIPGNKLFLEYLNNTLIPFYFKQWDKSLILKNKYILADNIYWVNYMSKHEYNPIHSHSGTLSFVVWIKIPYCIDAELNTPMHIKRTETNTSYPGIDFIYPDFTKRGGIAIYNHVLDKSSEGQIALFPSFLKHAVYPFYTSDEYRISISGNLIPENQNDRYCN